MKHEKVWLVLAFGMSERTFMVEVRGVYAHVAEAHNTLAELRRTEPNTSFRVQTHVLIDSHCEDIGISTAAGKLWYGEART